MEIGIVGLGLIGGSLGFDLRTLGHTVKGVSRQPQTGEQAIAMGIVDHASIHLSSLRDTEVIFLCTPIAAIVPTVQQLIPYLQPDTILTDVGSVKEPIVEAISPLWKQFIGGHPMAGKTTDGISAATPGLFANRPYVLTPVDNTSPQALARVEKLVHSLNARLYHCSPSNHDRSVAWISHLPVIVSASLIAACLEEDNTTVKQISQQLSSSGFRDTSRVGGGNPELGTMMAQYNQSCLLRSLHQYRQTLDRFIDQIEQSHWDKLAQELQKTQKERPRYLKED
ncbi:MAG: prephenate/arogenate dehydrogenase [Synechococcales bacterium]|nr:prephenate/arogenate dehydrogenase [Cyanobacteria bacterium REEB444]MEB3124260.1 prephenate/arogenate dehydrogenase [Synechococcales bacterium]